MKLSKIDIHAFRSIKDSTIEVSSIAALVGSNNAGKSTILRALNAFFNFNVELPYFLSGQHEYQPRTIPRIRLTFNELPNDPNLNNYYDGNILKLEFRFLKSGKASYRFHLGGSWADFPEIAMGSLQSHIAFVLIPPTRDHAAVTATENSLLSEIIHTYLSLHTQKRDTLTPGVKKLTDSFEKGIFAKIASGIQGAFPVETNTKCVLSFEDEVDYKHIVHNFSLTLKDNGRSFNLEDFGSGVQSIIIISLYRFLAELKHKKYILGIEEPETNLHPQAQKTLIRSLTADTEDPISSGVQIVFTTHSPAVVDELQHHHIVICRREDDASRPFRTASYQLPSDFFVKHRLDQQRHYNFYRYRNSEFFFSKHVILTEGKVDAEVISAISRKKGIDLISEGITILPFDGVGSFRYPFHLLTSLNIPFSVVVDKDFFISYKNGDVSTSLDPSGFPKYALPLKRDALDLLKSRRATAKQISDIETNLISNHTNALINLEALGIICFRYNLETDLVASSGCLGVVCGELNLPPDTTTARDILTNKGIRKKLKIAETLVSTINNLANSNLPMSYKKLRDHIASLPDK